MLSWIDFIIIIFIIIINFFIFYNNFLTILIIAELIWLILFVFSMLTSSINNDILIASLTFFMLGFSGLEFIIGFLLVILLKNFNISIKTNNNLNNLYIKKYNKKNINVKRWNI